MISRGHPSAVLKHFLSNQSTTPMPIASRPKVFISHKVLDKELVWYVRDQLLKLGLLDEEIYLAEETSPGTQWSPTLFNALTNSDTLIFLYTDPSYDWDWCLFECGYFAALPPIRSEPRSLVCINSGIGRPSPLGLWQDVSSVQALEAVLERLATRTQSSILDDKPAFSQFANQFWTAIYRRLPLKQIDSAEAFKQRRLAITVPPEEIAHVNDRSDFTDATKVEISDGARTIFPTAPLEAGWQQFRTSIREQSLQSKWLESIPVMVRMLNASRIHSPMLPLVRDALESSTAYRPSVAQRDQFGDGSVRYTIVFIRTPESTVASDSPTEHLYVWLTLARYFRQTVVELYSSRLLKIKTPAELRTWAHDLQSEITLAYIDTASRGMDIESDMDLFSAASRSSIERIQSQWAEVIEEFHELQVVLEGAHVMKNVPDTSARFVKLTEEKRAKANELLNRMRLLNSEFTLHVSASFLGCVTRPGF